MKELHEGIRGKLGQVPNVHQAMAVNSANNCGYCLDAHVAIAEMNGVTDDQIHTAVEVASAMSALNVFNHGANPECDF